eukprot:Tbor_TRINITY_DN2792_c0_g1::TRINITY_DN2792_c0_g1_i1::g.15196::m.15196
MIQENNTGECKDSVLEQTAKLTRGDEKEGNEVQLVEEDIQRQEQSTDDNNRSDVMYVISINDEISTDVHNIHETKDNAINDAPDTTSVEGMLSPTMIPVHYTSEGLMTLKHHMSYNENIKRLENYSSSRKIQQVSSPVKECAPQLPSHAMQQLNSNRSSSRKRLVSIVDNETAVTDTCSIHADDTPNNGNITGGFSSGFIEVPISVFSADTERWNVFPVNTIDKVINGPFSEHFVDQPHKRRSSQTPFQLDKSIPSTIHINKSIPAEHEEWDINEVMSNSSTAPLYNMTTSKTAREDILPAVHIDITEYGIPKEVINLALALLDPSLTIDEYTPLGLTYAIPLMLKRPTSNAAHVTPCLSSSFFSDGERTHTVSDGDSTTRAASLEPSTYQQNSTFLYNLIPKGSNILVPFNERREFVRRVMIEHHLCESVEFTRAIHSVSIPITCRSGSVSSNRFDPARDTATLPRISSILTSKRNIRYGVLSYIPLTKGELGSRASQWKTPVQIPTSSPISSHSLSLEPYSNLLNTNKNISSNPTSGNISSTIKSPVSPTLVRSAESSIHLSRKGIEALLVLRRHIKELGYLDFRQSKKNVTGHLSINQRLSDRSSHRRHGHTQKKNSITKVPCHPLVLSPVINGLGETVYESDAIIDVMSVFDSDSEYCTSEYPNIDYDDIIDEESYKAWASFRLAYCLRIHNHPYDNDEREDDCQLSLSDLDLKEKTGMSEGTDTRQQHKSQLVIDLVPQGHKIPVHINDRHYFIALALNKIDDILHSQNKWSNIIDNVPTIHVNGLHQEIHSGVRSVSTFQFGAPGSTNTTSKMDLPFQEGEEVYNLPEEQKRLFSPGHLGSALFSPPQPLTIFRPVSPDVTSNLVHSSSVRVGVFDPESNPGTSSHISVEASPTDTCSLTDNEQRVSLRSLLSTHDQNLLRREFSPTAAAALLVAHSRNPSQDIWFDSQMQ